VRRAADDWPTACTSVLSPNPATVIMPFGFRGHFAVTWLLTGPLRCAT
jgi:hypothetical protein